MVNSARSEVVELDAIYKFCKKERLLHGSKRLKIKKIRDKFRKLDNVYLTPHFGWMTKEAQQRLREITLNNIKSFLEGNPRNKVN